MNHKVVHNLDIAVVKTCVNKAFKSYSKKFAANKPTMDWVADYTAKISFVIGKDTINGKIDITSTSINMTLESSSFLVNLFKKQALKIIDAEIQIWLNKAHSGEI
ncbi:MAG: hypothetical protein ACOYLO_00380 [Ferruginibacter sp.]